ncbi:MAG: type II 3-dehydroquinate dehydratase [Coriobacteriales bacterium]|nr:type II 3-dehydroquinate dehydratase [Coriobacteriales bacterium]
MRILLLNGPNLNLLGEREPDIYGSCSLADVEAMVLEHATQAGVELDCFQSNHEGALIDRLQEARNVCAGVIYNPGAHAHYSYALRDAVASIHIPVVEVHISDVHAREDFRQKLVIAPVCAGLICGHGVQGYLEAFDLLMDIIGRQ